MSPLVINDTSLPPSELACFRQKVLTALGAICPGSVFLADATGRVTECESAGCADYCSHRAGCNMLACLLASGPESDPYPDVTIERGPSAYFASDNANAGQRNKLRWGGSGTTLSELAHELIHACHDYQGVHQGSEMFYDPLTDYEERKEELCTTCSENQIRAELALDARVQYAAGGIELDCSDLDQYGSPALVPPKPCNRLDTTDQRGCLCPTVISTGEAALVAEFPARVVRKVRETLGTLWEKLNLLWQQILERLGGTPRPSRPDDFAPLLDTGSDIDWLVRNANRSRHHERARRLPSGRIEELVDRSTHAVVLEAVSPFGYYGIMLLATVDAGARLLTNLEYLPDATAFIGEPTRVVSSLLPGFRSDLLARLESPVFMDFRSGIGGETQVNDGLTQFLTVKVGEEINRAVLHGYTHPGFDSRGRRDWVAESDLSQWDAVNAGIQLWRDGMAALGAAGRDAPR